MLHQIIYTTLLISFLCYKYFEVNGLVDQWLSSYFEDLIAMPIFLTTALLPIQLFHKKWRSFTIHYRDLFLLTLMVGVFFEFIQPKLHVEYTNDWLDFICYGAGTLFFALFLNRPRFTEGVNTRFDALFFE